MREELLKLVNLTQQLLLDEYSKGSMLFCGEDSYEFFRTELLQKAPEAKREPAPKKEVANLLIKPQAQPIAPPPSPPPAAPVIKAQPKETPPPQPPVAPAIKAQPQEPPPPVVETAPRTFDLQPLGSPPSEADTSDIKAILAKIAPNRPLRESPPDDSKARKKREEKPMVVLLAFDENPQCRAFLSNLTQAIRLELAPAALYSAPLVEQQKGWEELLSQEQLQLIVCSDYGLYNLPELMKQYRRSPSGKQHYIGGIKALLLADPALYLQQPTLKAPLWQALKTMVNSKEP